MLLKTTLVSSEDQKDAISTSRSQTKSTRTSPSGGTLKILTTLSSQASLSPHPVQPITNHTPDGEEILGTGDQGVGGILISIAKLVLTTLCGGIHPNRTLPVVLDCGTNNQGLLDDELYLGLKEKRVRGEEYAKFVDTFVKSARELYPNAYIHFEDFGLKNGRLATPDWSS